MGMGPITNIGDACYPLPDGAKVQTSDPTGNRKPNRKGNNVAKTNTTVVVDRREELQQMAATAIAAMKSTEFDTEQMMFDIMDADSIDDILGSEVLHLRDIIGVPFTVNGAELQDSTYEVGFMPVYAVMRVTFDDGQSGIVTTGAAQVVATLVAATAKEWFPFRVSTVEIITSSGNSVVKFVKAPAD